MAMAARSWKRPWGRRPETRLAAATERKAVLGTSDALGSFLIFGASTATTPSGALGLYEKSSAVSIPINMITEPFKGLEPVLLVGDKKMPDHPVVRLLKKPSPYYTQELFLETLAKNYLVTNESPVVALGRPNAPPLELQPISPASVSVKEGPGGLVEQYLVSGNTLNGSYVPKREGVNRVRYLAEKGPNLREFLFMRGYSTRSNSLLRGQSKLVSAAKEVRQHILGGEHNVSLLEKGGRVSLVFHFEENFGEDDFKVTRDRVREQYGGAEKAGNIGVTSGGKMKIQEMGQNAKDMDFVNLQRMAIKAVALQYRIPLPLVVDENQTLDNFRQGKLALYDDAVIPLSQVIFGGLGELLLPRYGLDPAEARIAFDPDKVTALVTRRNEELLKRSQINVDTKNEMRALIGRESIGAEGDTLLVPATMVPLGTDLFTDDNERDILEITE